MQLLGDRKFLEIPGDDTVQLPPLLVKDNVHVRRLDKVVDLASKVIEKEDWVPAQPLDALVPEAEVERRKMDLALNLVDQYLTLMRHWHWGDGILEWIRQCEITFESKARLRGLLRADVWPHAGRSSFVTLLADKRIPAEGIALEKAVGLRLSFRQPPPMACFSDQFLFYLNGTVASTAYQTWAQMSPEPISSLPPERFQVDVVAM
jgi:hypothetical protein